MARSRGLFVALVVALLATGGASRATSQPVQQPIAVVDQDRLFAESAWGQRVFSEIEARSETLAAENRRIEAELVAEEKDLTRRRQQMEADAFRVLAVEFDRKVQRLRNAQDAKARTLSRLQDRERQAFFSRGAEVLGQLLAERGAVALLDRRVVLLSQGGIDVTDAAISRIDAEIGDGADAIDPDDPDEEAPSVSPEPGDVPLPSDAAPASAPEASSEN